MEGNLRLLIDEFSTCIQWLGFTSVSLGYFFGF
jgi:hypothetical protein